MRIASIAVAALGVALLCGHQAHATVFLGDNVDASFTSTAPDFFYDSPQQAISPSATFSLPADASLAQVTVTDNTITVTFPNAGGFQTFGDGSDTITVTDDTGSNVGGVTIDPTTSADLSGGVPAGNVFGASDLSFTGNSVTINLNGLQVATGDQIVLDVAVPEPVSMSLLATGLIGLGLARRRRKAA